MSAASVQSDVQPARLGSPVPESGTQRFSNIDEMQSVEFHSADKIADLDIVLLTKVDTNILQTSFIDNNAGKSV